MRALKLSKASWLFLSVGIFIVVIASLGLTRTQQLAEQDQLDEELSVAELRMDKLQIKELRQQQQGLEAELEESTILLKAAKDKMRQPVESIDVTDEFFSIADSCGVEVKSISSSKIKSEDLQGVECSTITLSAVVNGSLSNLIDFIISLNGDFTTGIVKTAQLSVKESAEDVSTAASVIMVIYAYEGD